jgi:hypothetical protein
MGLTGVYLNQYFLGCFVSLGLASSTAGFGRMGQPNNGRIF